MVSGAGAVLGMYACGVLPAIVGPGPNGDGVCCAVTRGVPCGVAWCEPAGDCNGTGAAVSSQGGLATCRKLLG